jgi:hypothetical protein
MPAPRYGQPRRCCAVPVAQGADAFLGAPPPPPPPGPHGCQPDEPQLRGCAREGDARSRLGRRRRRGRRPGRSALSTEDVGLGHGRARPARDPSSLWPCHACALSTVPTSSQGIPVDRRLSTSQVRRVLTFERRLPSLIQRAAHGSQPRRGTGTRDEAGRDGALARAPLVRGPRRGRVHRAHSTHAMSSATTRGAAIDVSRSRVEHAGSSRSPPPAQGGGDRARTRQLAVSGRGHAVDVIAEQAPSASSSARTWDCACGMASGAR